MHIGCANLRDPMDWNDLRYFLAIAQSGCGYWLAVRVGPS